MGFTAYHPIVPSKDQQFFTKADDHLLGISKIHDYRCLFPNILPLFDNIIDIWYPYEINWEEDKYKFLHNLYLITEKKNYIYIPDLMKEDKLYYEYQRMRTRLFTYFLDGLFRMTLSISDCLTLNSALSFLF